MKVGVGTAKRTDVSTAETAAAEPSAFEISVRETLALLDNEQQSFAEGVCSGLYAFWLGSGISRERFPMVPDLIVKVLEFMRDRADIANADCPYHCALLEALDLASVTDTERKNIDFDEQVSNWDIVGSLKDRLSEKYETLLGIEIGSEPSDILVWEGIDVADTYADPSVEPDVTHYCIATLILEGLAKELATANWDGLVEKAVEQLAGNSDVVAVCVQSEDIQSIGQRPSLIKFHGCAVRAKSDPDKYRSMIVGRGAQIADWDNKVETKGIQSTLVTSIIKNPSLVMGLSIQDFNIQHLFGEAKGKLDWPWPGDRPSYVFSEDKVTPGQKNLLEIVYKTYDTDKEAIKKSALVRAFPKQLLVALVLYTLTDKLQKISRIKSDLKPDLLGAWIGEGLLDLRDCVGSLEVLPSIDFIKSLLSEITRIHRTSVLGEIETNGSRYTPIWPGTVSETNPPPALLNSGLPEAAVVGGIIGKGVSGDAWTIEKSSHEGAVGLVCTEHRKVPIYLANTTKAENELLQSGILKTTDNAILVRGFKPYARRQRSSSKPLRKKGKPGLIEIDILDLVAISADSDDLFSGFQREGIL